MFWIRKRPFLSQKAPKSAPIFFFKKRHNFGQRRHNLRLFLLAWNCKWPTMPFLLHFYVTISPKFPILTCFQDSSIQSTGKILFFKIFLRAPKFFRRHKECQKRHSGAKAPQLRPLLKTQNENLKSPICFVYGLTMRASR